MSSFTPAIGAQPSPHPKTPYDGKVAIWHWKGLAVPQSSIADLLADIRAKAPEVTQIWVKVTDGANWMGEYDSGALAIRGAREHRPVGGSLSQRRL